MYLALEHLSKIFPERGHVREVRAVDNVSLAIAQGEFVTLLGPSGCGTTTTLRLIAGFESPTQGHMTLDGRCLDDVPPNRHDMAMVFQSYVIFLHPSVFENLAYGLRIKRFPVAEIRHKIAQVLHLAELTGLEYRTPHQLSGGQQQRVALACVLVQAAAMTLSDRIVQVDTAYEVYRRLVNAFVADFIGKANFLPAQVVDVAADHLDLEVLGRPLSLLPSDGARRLGERALPLARPEAIVPQRHGDGYAGRVRRTAYLGPIIEYEVEVTGTVLSLAQYDPRQVYAIGTEVRVQLVTDAVYLLPEEAEGEGWQP
jgi:iron(III) transport system ATP-binding protein